VAERTEHNVRTVIPLIAWRVTADDEVHPIPKLDKTWIVRPFMQGDESHIRTSAARMRPTSDRRNEWSY
jgi:hypothetical protein